MALDLGGNENNINIAHTNTNHINLYPVVVMTLYGDKYREYKKERWRYYWYFSLILFSLMFPIQCF